MLAVAEFLGASAAISLGSRRSHWQICVVSPPHQIDMDMVLMLRICSVTEHCRKASARRSPQTFA